MKVRQCPTCTTEIHTGLSGSCHVCERQERIERRLLVAKRTNKRDMVKRGFAETRIIRNPAAYYGW